MNLEALAEQWRREEENREAIRCGGYVPPSKADIARAFNCAEDFPAVEAVWMMFKPYLDKLASFEAWHQEPKYEAHFPNGSTMVFGPAKDPLVSTDTDFLHPN